jgi:hypothetical protein
MDKSIVRHNGYQLHPGNSRNPAAFSWHDDMRILKNTRVTLTSLGFLPTRVPDEVGLDVLAARRFVTFDNFVEHIIKYVVIVPTG